MHGLEQAMAGPIEKGETCQLQHPECRLAEKLWLALLPVILLTYRLFKGLGSTRNRRPKTRYIFKKRLGVAGASGRRFLNAGFLINVLVRTFQNGLDHVDAHGRVGFTKSLEKPAVHTKGQRGSEEDVCSRVKSILVALVAWLVSVPRPIIGVRSYGFQAILKRSK
jgi:hypothetical protein